MTYGTLRACPGSRRARQRLQNVHNSPAKLGQVGLFTFRLIRRASLKSVNGK